MRPARLWATVAASTSATRKLRMAALAIKAAVARKEALAKKEALAARRQVMMMIVKVLLATTAAPRLARQAAPALAYLSYYY